RPKLASGLSGELCLMKTPSVFNFAVNKRSFEGKFGSGDWITAKSSPSGSQESVSPSRACHAETIRLLRPIRSYAHRFGGSHAQPDVINLTLIEAAARSGRDRLAQALRNERTGG